MVNELPVLADIDGVLRIGRKPAEGLSEFFGFLNQFSIPACLISNSTLSSSNDIRDFFKANNIDTGHPVMTASDATANYVKQNYSSAAIYCIPGIKRLFSEVITDSENPEAVVMGDMGDAWNFDILSEIFRKVRSGADLIAMQKNRFWKTPDRGYILDLGPFVSAIEYAADREAIVIGKPSGIYFREALKIAGYRGDGKFVMIGDDIETDILAAKELGAVTILMYTGKTPYPLSREYEGVPDYHSNSLSETIEILKKIMGIK